MNILVSACLLGIPCRYDGQAKPDKAVLALKHSGHTLFPVCPEVLGGLPTPRPPAELQGDQIINRSAQNVTKQYHAGAELALAMMREHRCTLAILKERSPSCGSKQVYDGTFSGTLIDGKGIAAAKLFEAGYSVIGESDVVAYFAQTNDLLFSNPGGNTDA